VKEPKITVICMRCETEWDADKRSPDGPCPACGLDFTNFPEDHIVRIEEEDNDA